MILYYLRQRLDGTPGYIVTNNYAMYTWYRAFNGEVILIEGED